MVISVKPEKEVSFESTLIPEGTLVECVISGSEAPKKSQNTDNYSLNWELTVLKGTYAGSRMYDNVGTAGTERYVTQGKMKMAYALEINKQAHTSGNYDINSHAEFNGMRVVIKAGVEVKTGKDGKSFYVNKASAYGSPRPDSRNHQLFKDYVDGLQPYQTDKLPPLPVQRAGGYSPTGAPPAGHPAFNDDIGF